MVELADILRLHGDDYQVRHSDRMLPSHFRAMRDIDCCRTPVMGGQIYTCPRCPDEYLYAYHSCKNRACPKCQNHETTRWIESQADYLLPVDYFMLTFTLPHAFNNLARSHQRDVYSAFFRASSESFLLLAARKKHLDGRAGMMGVLQTWARDMSYHVHIHYIVPGGALSHDGMRWNAHRYSRWLVPVKALSVCFKRHFKRELEKLGLADTVNSDIWVKPWIVHCQPAGSGQEVIRYLAPYIFRIAISNNRIERLENGQVSFRYRDNDDQWQSITVPVDEFIRRFLQHVLPKGFVKVRYYGFMAPRLRTRSFTAIIRLLQIRSITAKILHKTGILISRPIVHQTLCPHCRKPMVLLHILPRLTLCTRAPPILEHMS